MRILLQQKDTGRYFKDINSWTEDTLDAMDFLNSTEAMDFCKSNNLAGVQLVLKFEQQRYDIVMPLGMTRGPYEEGQRDAL